MEIVTVLPVSRLSYLDRVIETLEKQTVKSQSLIVVFDGNNDDYLTARNRVVGLNYRQVLCVKSLNETPADAIPERRRHIASIHNQVRDMVGGADWIFSVEDDGLLPANALERLLDVAQSHDDPGLVTGVELGRWGVPYVGAWRVDNVFTPEHVTSVASHAGEDLIEEIDACGLYCALVRADLYGLHMFNADNGLGPDVNLALFIRQHGFANYIDWAVTVTHLTNMNGVEIEIPATDPTMTVELISAGNNYWRQIKY